MTTSADEAGTAMSGFWGMDTDEVRELRGRVQARAEDLARLEVTLASLIEATSWTGADAESFRGDWGARIRPRIAEGVAELRQHVGTLEAQSDAQDVLSGVGPVGGGGGGSGAGDSGGSGMRRVATLPAEGSLTNTNPGEMLPRWPELGHPVEPIWRMPIVCDPPMPPVSDRPPLEVGPAPVFPEWPDIETLPGEVPPEIVTLPAEGIHPPEFVTLPAEVPPEFVTLPAFEELPSPSGPVQPQGTTASAAVGRGDSG